VEDAAQAIGASHKGRKAGAMGNAGCLSFYPTKNLGCFGDGGMITTNNKSVADTARMLRVHGSKTRYYHELVGFNSRLDEIQASVLRIKLRYLDSWAESRGKNAAIYYSALKGLQDVILPHVEEGNHMVFNQFVARVRGRDALRRHLDSKGIGSEIYYPVPLHMQKCFGNLGYKKGDFPESEAAAKETIALPIYPELKKEEILYVAGRIREFYGK
ncbi:MAG: DegT/DnrJ/EryC1/StrS family aminotransferase, partial [Thermodesulfobacteriota bacterium]